MAARKTERNGNRLIATLMTAITTLVIAGVTPARAQEPQEVMSLDLVESQESEPAVADQSWPAFRETDAEQEPPQFGSFALKAATTTSNEDPQSVLAAPLPPAVLTGGALLVVNFAVSMLRAKRRIC